MAEIAGTTTNSQALTFLVILLLFTQGNFGNMFGDNSLLFLTILLLFLGGGIN